MHQVELLLSVLFLAMVLVEEQLILPGQVRNTDLKKKACNLLYFACQLACWQQSTGSAFVA